MASVVDARSARHLQEIAAAELANASGRKRQQLKPPRPDHGPAPLRRTIVGKRPPAGHLPVRAVLLGGIG